MNSFYLAGPFFKPEQIHVLEEIEEKAKAIGLKCFSPRIELHCAPDASLEIRKKAFDGNCQGIRYADFVLARIDDFDPGTVWELGYAFGIKGFYQMAIEGKRDNLKIYAFTTVPGRGLNLMLAQGADGFLVGIPEVLGFLEDVSIGMGDGRAKKWMQDIQ